MLNAITEYATNHNIKIEYVKDKKFKAFCFEVNGQQYIVINETYFKSSEELTKALLHELGHCMTNTFYEINTPLKEKLQCEKVADEWANAFKKENLHTV